MKTKKLLLCAILCSLFCTLAACSSDDEPEKTEPKIPEGLVSAEEFTRIVDNKVWIFDDDYESVWVNAKGEEFSEDALELSGSSFFGFSFKDGKKATLIWPPFEKQPYKDYRYDPYTGYMYGTYNPDVPSYIFESITPERIVIRYWLDEVPAGIGKDPATWTEEDREPEKGSYRRVALKVADEEATEYYLKHYVEE